MVDEFPADLSTPIGRVRKYIPDLVQLSNPADPEADPSYIFSDDEIEAFINDETADGTYEITSWRIRKAAAWAILALANSENLILKKITVEDQQTDGPAVARELRQNAEALFALAAKEELAADGLEGFIHVPYQGDQGYYDPTRAPHDHYPRGPYWTVV